jgi:biotin transporter BioY
MDSSKVSKAFITSVGVSIATTLIPVILQYIPLLGEVFTGIEYLSPSLLWSFGFVISYIFGNMVNQEIYDDMCNSTPTSMNQIITFVGLILIFNVGKSYMDDMETTEFAMPSYNKSD